MKPVPKTPEFTRFVEAMKQIVSVPKAEILRREQQAKEERKLRRASASGRAAGASAKRRQP
jgi:hypothetical protein